MLLQASNKHLENYSQLGLYRQRQQLESAQGVAINYNGKNCISFCSNDYLGLANHPLVVSAFKAGADKYGVGSGASQLITGHSAAHHALENAFAEFLGRESALLFSNGYMANVGVLSAIMQEGTIFADKLSHASLIDGAHLSDAKLQRYAHKNNAHLLSLLNKFPSQQKMIVTDSVFSMDGDLAPLPELATIAKQNNAWLMVDDAHGIGVLGKNGRGSCEYFNLDTDAVPILICPL
jgi:8-amino-7-oxononanoate synthase